jgi:hypothetical protein
VELDVLGEDVGQGVPIVLEGGRRHAVDHGDIRVFAHDSSGRGGGRLTVNAELR